VPVALAAGWRRTPPAGAPRRWHVHVVDLERRVGAKPGKRRRCLANQPSEFGEAGCASTVVLPLTTNVAVFGSVVTV
jgi:mRNA-degrading endonuclease toxin of MazEF toxin-antitoxin module